MFLTIEGGEGAGKSTLIQGIKSALERMGHRVLLTREPGGTPLGEHIRECLLSPQFAKKISPQSELLLFLASRTEHIEQVIKPALLRGEVVLCDRFNDSTIAYQGGGRNLGIDYVEKMCSLACHGLNPDLTFFLDISPDVGMSRIQREKDRLESEPNSFHNQVRNAFHMLARRHADRIHVLDATQKPEKVLADALIAVTERF